MNNKLYNHMKLLAQIILPALGTLYFTIAGIWGLPNAEEVVGSIVALDAFLGVLLSLSTAAYNDSDDKFDGTLEVEKNGDGEKLFTLHLGDDPEALENKKEIVFKVNPPM